MACPCLALSRLEPGPDVSQEQDERSGDAWWSERTLALGDQTCRRIPALGQGAARERAWECEWAEARTQRAQRGAAREQHQEEKGCSAEQAKAR